MVKPWYKDGLKFKCTQCGHCCTGSPGYVWVTDAEIETMSRRLKLSVQEFCDKYVRVVFGKKSLREHPKTYDCVFLKGKQCTLYEARPQQCRQFPWWPHNLESPEAWKEAAKGCEGINHPDAPVVAFEIIQEQM